MKKNFMAYKNHRTIYIRYTRTRTQSIHCVKKHKLKKYTAF